MPTNYLIPKPNKIFPGHFTVTEYATIISTFYKNQANHLI